MRTITTVLPAYVMVFALAELAGGFALKRSHKVQDFSKASNFEDLFQSYGPKPLQGRKTLITDTQIKGGDAPVKGEVATQRRSREGQFHMVSSKQGNSVVFDWGSNALEKKSLNEYLRTSVRTMPSHMKLRRDKRNEASLRYKRRIFPPDNRRRITNYQASHRFPHSATVKISTGCTGTLISNQHVLTAAHCIHNRTHYITTTSNIRVGFLKSNGQFRWFRVTSVRFPRNEWMNSKGSRYDYAVLTLRKPHKRKFFRLAESSKSSFHIHFSSFPGDKRSNSLWYVDCSAIVLSRRPIIVGQCDATKGSSGAGVYTVVQRRGKNKRVIIGVLSGATDLLKLPNGRSSSFNVAVSLKAADIRNICSWAGSPRGCPS